MDDPAEDYLTTLESAVVADNQPSPLVGDRRWLRRVAWAAALIGIPAFATAWFRPADVRLFSDPIDAAVVGILGFAGLVIVSRWSKRRHWVVELGTFAGVAGVVLIALGASLMVVLGSGYRRAADRFPVADSNASIAAITESTTTEIVIQSPLGPLTRERVVLVGQDCEGGSIEAVDGRTFLVIVSGGSGCDSAGRHVVRVGEDGWSYTIEAAPMPTYGVDDPCVEPSESSMTCMD